MLVILSEWRPRYATGSHGRIPAGKRSPSCCELQRSSALNLIVGALVVACGATLASEAGVAQVGLASDTPPTVDGVRDSVKPMTDLVVGLSYLFARVWHYLMANSSLAILLSAALASLFASLSINNQRAMTRLRETFATINDDNWDQDVIKARAVFSNIKQEIGPDKHAIAKYCDPPSDPSLTEKVVTLHTILNDYENLALGVRHNIVDEEFLYRWMRGALLEDWGVLSPLVSAYRSRRNNSNVYIEFEGLASAWFDDRSYRTGRKLNRAIKRISVR